MATLGSPVTLVYLVSQAYLASLASQAGPAIPVYLALAA